MLIIVVVVVIMFLMIYPVVMDKTMTKHESDISKPKPSREVIEIQTGKMESFKAKVEELEEKLDKYKGGIMHLGAGATIEPVSPSSYLWHSSYSTPPLMLRVPGPVAENYALGQAEPITQKHSDELAADIDVPQERVNHWAWIEFLNTEEGKYFAKIQREQRRAEEDAAEPYTNEIASFLRTEIEQRVPPHVHFQRIAPSISSCWVP